MDDARITEIFDQVVAEYEGSELQGNRPILHKCLQKAGFDTYDEYTRGRMCSLAFRNREDAFRNDKITARALIWIIRYIEKWHTIFEYEEVEKKGYLTMQELKAVIEHFGFELPDSYYKCMMEIPLAPNLRHERVEVRDFIIVISFLECSRNGNHRMFNSHHHNLDHRAMWARSTWQQRILYFIGYRLESILDNTRAQQESDYQFKYYEHPGNLYDPDDIDWQNGLLEEFRNMHDTW